MQQTLNLSGDPKTRDSLAEVGLKCNQNFGELYAAVNALTGTIQVNAPSASKLETPRVILLQGEAFGSALFDGSGNAVLNVKVNASFTSTANAIVRRDVNGAISVGTCATTGIVSQATAVSERYRSDAPYGIGTVVVFGGNAEVTTTTQTGDPRAAGVVVLDPAMTLNASRGGDTSFPRVAVLGRTPCKVLGPIQKGDLLVTAETPGYAQATTNPQVGTVIGKALQDFSGRQGLVDIAVMVL